METVMKLLISLVLFTLLTTPAVAERYSQEKQMQLDARCEDAREKKLIPIREQLVDECVANGELPNNQECKRFYANYGERMGRRAPLFYDLPECVEAFDYQQSVRSPD